MRFLLLALSLSLSAQPRLLFNPADAARIRKTAPTQPWAAEVLASLIRDADAWPASHVREYGLKQWALPPEGSGWSHAYVCPEHGARLRQRKGKNLCPVDGKDHRGSPIDQVVYMHRNSDNSRAARDLGLAFHLTGKPVYAEKARRILNAYTSLYPTLPVHDNQNRRDTRTGARVMSQTLSESQWLVPLVFAYDLVRDTMPAGERAAFEEQVLREAARVIAKYDARQSNWQSWHNAALLAVGLAVGDPALVRLALDGPSGYKFQLRASIQPDGAWYEGAWGYHFYAFDPLALTHEMARRAGLPLPESAALKGMLDAPLKCVFPDLSLPNFNDSGLVKLDSSARHYEFGFHAFADPAFAAVFRGAPRTLNSLFYDLGSPAARALPALTSEVLRESGIATLRVAGSDHTLAVKFGPHGGGHGHFDKLNFISFAHGAHQAADPGTQAYAAKTHATWDKESIAHNTVVIDEKTQAQATGELLEWVVQPRFTAIRLDAGPAYPQVALERLLVHTARYTLDVFDVRARSGAPHRIDWIYHNYGAADPLPGAAPYQLLPAASGYQHLSAPRAAELPGDWSAVFRQPNGAGLRLRMLAAPATTVVQGHGLGPDLQIPVPFVLARRQATSTSFVTLLEPFRGAVPQTTFRQAGPEEFLVEGPGFRHRIIATRGALAIQGQ